MTWLNPRSNFLKAGALVGSPDGGRYLQATIEGGRYRLHRLAWLYVHGMWPNGLIDHVNGDGSDNRIANLREATASQNRANTVRQLEGRTLPRGVKQEARTGKFVATLGRKGKNIHLGTFGTADEAAEAYLRAARESFGQFYPMGA